MRTSAYYGFFEIYVSARTREEGESIFPRFFMDGPLLLFIVYFVLLSHMPDAGASGVATGFVANVTLCLATFIRILQ